MTLTQWWDYYRTLISVMLATHAQYRLANILWMLGLLIEPVIYLSVWSQVANAQGGEVNGYDAGRFAAYYVVLMIVRQLGVANNIHGISWRIKDGEMSSFLVRPVSQFHYDWGDAIVSRLMAIPFLSVLVVFITLTFGATFRLTAWDVLAFIPAVILAGVVRFLVLYTIAALAFWTTRIDGIWLTYVTFQTVLGGFIAPIALLPEPLKTLAYVLPYRWMFSFPIEVGMGGMNSAQVIEGLAMQVIWAAALLGLYQISWQAGLRQYSAVGG
jgi:ABC-2 type transport system permease protein